VREISREINMHTPPTLISMSTLTVMLQRSRASIYRDIARGDFPKPLKLGRSSRWPLADVEAYIANLSNDRGPA
jgi:predicted DNA-binding transcriptional regulator AlpA